MRITSIQKIIIILLTLILGYFFVIAFFIEPNELIINRKTIKLKKHINLKIAVIADIHAGAPFIKENKLKQIVELTNKEKPDIIFLMGDYVAQKVIGRTLIEPEPIADILAGLKAPYGVIAILGNHDWWYNGKRVESAFESKRFTVLENDVKRLNINGKTLWIAGVADLSTRFPDIDATLSKIKDNNPIILLSHNPDVFPFISSRVSLTISGHTHGGQVVFPFVGMLIIHSTYGQRFVTGEITENGNKLFLTNGIGTSEIPVRFGAVPEIAILTLK